MTEPTLRMLRVVARVLGMMSGRVSGWLTALALCLLLAVPAVARAETGRAEGWSFASATATGRVGRLVLHYEPELGRDAAFLLEHAPRWWSDTETALSGDLDDALEITFLRHPGAVAEETGMPRWVAGVASPGRGQIAIARFAPDGSPTDLERLLRHEMAHVALERAVEGRAIPRWLHEGTAENLERGIDLARAKTLALSVFGAGVPTLAALERDFRGEDAQTVAVAYAAARDLVGQLRGVDPRGATFRQLLSEIRLGYPLEEAFVRAYGAPLSELVRDWRSGLPGRFVWAALSESGGLPVIVVAPLLFGAWARRRRERRAGWARLEREDELERRLRTPRPVVQVAVPQRC